MRNRKQDIREGMAAGIPIGLGYFTVSFAFGMLAKQGGLSVLEATAISVTNLTSAGQFAGLDIILAGGALMEMALTQFIINLRYFLMSCSLSQKLAKGTGIIKRLLIAFGITDEIFGMSALRKTDVTITYFYAMLIPAFIGWGGGTLVGALAGGILPSRIVSALGLALYSMFLAIIIPPCKKSRPILWVVLITMIASFVCSIAPVLKHISTGFRVIILTVLIAGIAAYVAPVQEKEEDNPEIAE